MKIFDKFSFHRGIIKQVTENRKEKTNIHGHHKNNGGQKNIEKYSEIFGFPNL